MEREIVYRVEHRTSKWDNLPVHHGPYNGWLHRSIYETFEHDKALHPAPHLEELPVGGSYFFAFNSIVDAYDWFPAHARQVLRDRGYVIRELKVVLVGVGKAQCVFDASMPVTCKGVQPLLVHL
jgi:hypothetical protein